MIGLVIGWLVLCLSMVCWFEIMIRTEKKNDERRKAWAIETRRKLKNPRPHGRVQS